MAANKNDGLEEFRSKIDAIDDKILDLLARRANIVKQVGDMKRQKGNKKSIIRPGREAEMVRRIANHPTGADNVFPRAAVAYMWRMIISSAISIEENPCISTLSMPSNRESFWLAREYFGGFTPMKQHPTMMEVIRDILEGKATVGVLPLLDQDSPQPWWSRLIEEKTAPKIFSRLPFIQMAPSQKTPLVGMGYVDPEETGDDESVWVVKSQEVVTLSTIENMMKGEGLEFELKGECRVLANPTNHQQLFIIKGFVNDKDKKIAKFVAKANESYSKTSLPLSAHWLGSYATPILFNDGSEASNAGEE